jgi:hypothetical protein
MGRALESAHVGARCPLEQHLELAVARIHAALAE